MKQRQHFSNSSAFSPSRLQRLLLVLFTGLVGAQFVFGTPISAQSLLTIMVGLVIGLLVVQNLPAPKPKKKVVSPVQTATVPKPVVKAKVADIPVVKNSRSSVDAIEELTEDPMLTKPQSSPQAATQVVNPGHTSGANMLPGCAFLFNTQSSKPCTFLLPDIATANSLIMVPKELSQFFNQSILDVVNHGNDMKILKPVNAEYKQDIKNMALNDVNNVLENGSLVLPIHFMSRN